MSVIEMSIEDKIFGNMSGHLVHRKINCPGWISSNKYRLEETAEPRENSKEKSKVYNGKLPCRWERPFQKRTADNGYELTLKRRNKLLGLYKGITMNKRLWIILRND